MCNVIIAALKTTYNCSVPYPWHDRNHKTWL